MNTLTGTRTQIATKWFCTTLLLLPAAGVLIAVGASKAQNAEEAYPFGIQLRVLAQDVVSPNYREIVRAMLTTDLQEEWKRVATPDNYVIFMQTHGGRERVTGDSRLKSAYEKRKKAADGNFSVIRGWRRMLLAESYPLMHNAGR